MNEVLNELESHQHTTNRLVRDTLRSVARSTGHSLPQVLQDFKGGDIDTTVLFWLIIDKEHAGKFSGVYYCHSCKKFTLNPKLH